MSTRISIVIAAQNMRAWVGETLDSVLALDYPPSLLDLIVIDDGSVDGTAEVTRARLSKAPMKWLVQSQSRSGPSGARNAGAGLCQGEWIQFLDSDDLLDSNKLKHQSKVARAAPSTTAVIYSPWTRVDLKGEVWQPRVPIRNPAIGPDGVLSLLQSENFIATGSQLFQRGWFKAVGGFAPECNLLEDVDLAIRLAMAGGGFVACPSPAPLFYYRQHPDSLSRRSPLLFARACARNARLAENYWKKQQAELSPEQKALLLEIYGNALRALFAPDPPGFTELLAHVCTLDPDYCPCHPKPLRWLTKVIGYPRAERCAVEWRRIKRVIAELKRDPRQRRAHAENLAAKLRQNFDS